MAWAGEPRVTAGRIPQRPVFFDRFGEASAD